MNCILLYIHRITSTHGCWLFYDERSYCYSYLSGTVLFGMLIHLISAPLEQEVHQFIVRFPMGLAFLFIIFFLQERQ